MGEDEIKLTQLYSDTKKIYPITTAVGVLTKSGNNVEEQLSDIYKHISHLEGADTATSNIIVNVLYTITDTNKESDIKELGSEKWKSVFVQPTREYPYAWKKTLFTYKGDKNPLENLKTLYEIITTDLSERIDTIYISLPTSENTGLINYPKIENPFNKEEQINDPHAFDVELPKTTSGAQWSREPQPISPSKPYAFMATRKMNTKELIDNPDKVNFGPGNWGYFTAPAQYGCWPADSILVTNYATSLSLEAPSINRESEIPEGWKSEITTIPPEFKGSIWMITANKVNGEFNVDTHKNIWSNPTLLSIIK